MWTRKLLLAAVLVFAVWAEAAAESAIGLRLGLQHTGSETGRLFSVPDEFSQIPKNAARQDVYARYGGKYITFNGRASAEQEPDGKRHYEKGVVNELSADFEVAGYEIGVGKKVASWGVGYGFRPLDVIQRENRQAIEPLDLEGAPMIMAERFDAYSSLTMAIVNHASYDGMAPRAGIYEGAAKYFTKAGNLDLHMALYANENEKMSFGAGMAAVTGEHLETHASFRFLPSYFKKAIWSASPAGSAQDERHENGLQALAGASWTWANGWTILGEMWHDSAAYSLREWNAIYSFAGRLNSLPTGNGAEGAYPGISAAKNLFEGSNTLQNNIFLRLSYTDDDFKPYISVLWTPEDGGTVLTAVADWHALDRIVLFAAARTIGGQSGSAYYESGSGSVVFAGVKIEGELN